MDQVRRRMDLREKGYRNENNLYIQLSGWFLPAYALGMHTSSESKFVHIMLVAILYRIFDEHGQMVLIDPPKQYRVKRLLAVGSGRRGCRKK